MSGIFINFRGDDGEDRAWGLDIALAHEFGRDRVFRSSRSIPAGAEFPPALLDGVGSASVVLVLIGPRWLEVMEDGSRRIDDPEDWVRKEIVEAFRLGKIVIPLLPRDVRLPGVDVLPPDIAALATRQHFRLDYRTAEQDIADLIEKLIRIDPALGIGSVEGLEDLQKWFETWRYFTSPPLPGDLFVLGRDREAERLCSWLDAEPSVLTVYAPGRSEAAAFVAMTVAAHRPETRAARVTTREGWQHCRTLTGPYLAVVDTPDVEVGLGDAVGGHVVVVLQSPDQPGSDPLVLPRIPRDKAAEAFAAAGIPPGEADLYGAIARRSISSLRRKLAPFAGPPDWTRPPDSALVAPLVLAGRWSAGADADRVEVAELIEGELSELDDFLARVDSGGDPLLHRSGARWQLADPQDAWVLLRGKLSSEDLRRWRACAIKVLSEPDPALVLPPGERIYAGVRGHVRKWSAELRHGLAQGAALLGETDQALADGVTGADHAAIAVRDLLAKANDDATGLLWRSLCDVLPLLAEAAPGEFLDAVDLGLADPAQVMRRFFDDEEAAPRSFPPHTGLLWALESISWSDHLPMVVTVLAELARIDPGGRTSNRPAESLLVLLQAWYPYLNLPDGQRTELVKAVCRRTPDVGWNLVLALLGDSSGHLLISPRRPEVRLDWPVPEPPVNSDDHPAFRDDLVTVLLAALVPEPRRWSAFFEELPHLTRAQWDRVVAGLQELDVDRLSGEERFQLWSVLNEKIAQHRHYAAAEWALPEDLLARLEVCAGTIEPEGNVRRHARLFGWHPNLAGIDPFDHEAHRVELDRLRLDAVRGVLRDHGVSGLAELAQASAVPQLVGAAAAEVAGDDIREDALAVLGQEVWASGWVNEMARTLGEEWAETTAKLLEGQPNLLDFLLAIPVDHALPMLPWAGDEVSRGYWAAVRFWPLPAGLEEQFVTQLLSHRRPWAAINALALALHGPEHSPLPASLVEEALTRGLDQDVDEPDQHAIYQVGRLLDFMIEAGTDAVAVARLELLYNPGLKYRRKPRVLYRILAEDPVAYVDLYCTVHSTEGANPAPARVHSWLAMFEMRTVPGHTDDGLDEAVLKDWVSRARALFAERGRAESGDRSIGTVLSGSPDGADGAWPAEAVRDVLDVADGTFLREGFATGLANNRGMTVRDSYAGGEQERELAARYRAWAQRMNVGWPRVAAVLNRYAAELEREGRRNDGRADEVHDEP
ncbi:MAG TPA: toll/interleukin-1 receptor domain-containing protein [Kribbella sp.]|nr:toll/interleukin-1 receptor domain-containing protein [Kribbella sp.]